MEKVLSVVNSAFDAYIAQQLALGTIPCAGGTRRVNNTSAAPHRPRASQCEPGPGEHVAQQLFSYFLGIWTTKCESCGTS